MNDSVRFSPEMLLDTWRSLQKTIAQKQLTYNNAIINYFAQEIAHCEQTALCHYANVLSSYIEIEKAYQKKNKAESPSFNALRFFEIDEPKHSFLLVKLLHPHAEHGQGTLFLNKFLQAAGIEDPHIGNWTVTAEKGRIDVLLTRDQPHSVIVIENKSNNAVDQEHQLYRYWFQKILLPNCHRADPVSFIQQHPERYKVIYLRSNDWKEPGGTTLLKPPALEMALPTGCKIELPERLPMSVDIWSFNKEIVDWLKQSLLQLPSTNHRMQQYLEQYIDYWF